MLFVFVLDPMRIGMQQVWECGFLKKKWGSYRWVGGGGGGGGATLSEVFVSQLDTTRLVYRTGSVMMPHGSLCVKSRSFLHTHCNHPGTSVWEGSFLKLLLAYRLW